MLLILEKGCQECGAVKAVLDNNKVEDPLFSGKDGAVIFVMQTMNCEVTKYICRQFGVSETAPLLIKDDKTEVKDVDVIINTIRNIGYGKT